MKNYPKNDELSTIRQQLNRIEAQIYRKDIPPPQELTIDNKSGKILKFTINLNNNQHTTSNIALNSQITIPNNSSLTHVVQTDYSNHNYIQKSHLIARNATNHRDFDQSHANYLQKSHFTIRQQQKFLPINRLSIDQQSQRRKRQHGNQILIGDQEDQDQSQINKDQEINKMLESHYVKNPYTGLRKDSQKYEDNQENCKIHQQSHIKIEGQIIESVSLPFTIKKSNKIIQPDTSQTAQKQQKQDKSHYEDLHRSLSWTFNSLQASNMKRQDQNAHKQWKVQLITPAPKRVSVKIENQKKYSDLFKKNKKSQRESRLHQRLKTTVEDTIIPKNSHSRCVSKQKQVIIHKTSNDSKKLKKATTKADDLFTQRKDEYLKKLQKDKKQINYIRKHSNSKDKFITIDFNKQKKNESPQKAANLSPMIVQIGNRLHSSKGKLPCEYYNKFSKSQQRQRFNILVKQNIYASRYISRDEIEQLFESLLKSQDSISLWPTKIANYTMIKMKRVAHSMKHDFY